MKTFLITMAGLLMWSAAPVWFAWTLYQIFVLTSPFWSTIISAIAAFIAQVAVAVLMYGFAVVSIGRSNKVKY
jgi:hypothetical protein